MSTRTGAAIPSPRSLLSADRLAAPARRRPGAATRSRGPWHRSGRSRWRQYRPYQSGCAWPLTACGSGICTLPLVTAAVGFCRNLRRNRRAAFARQPQPSGPLGRDDPHDVRVVAEAGDLAFLDSQEPELARLADCIAHGGLGDTSDRGEVRHGHTSDRNEAQHTAVSTAWIGLGDCYADADALGSFGCSGSRRCWRGGGKGLPQRRCRGWLRR
jgi:hypothetical protein